MNDVFADHSLDRMSESCETAFVMRKIIHVDMDCFYAAVEIRDRPELRGRPVAVGGSPEGRGVIATSSYEARKFGVRSAMSSAQAVRICPELVIVRPDFSKYKKESRKVREIFSRFTQRIEPLSLDEAYLDVSESNWFNGSATHMAQEIRRLIFEETRLTASAGIAPNKFLAKVASDINKPNGQKTIRPEDVSSFVQTLPIEKIWGVGRVTAEKMHRLGLRTCGDLQRLSVVELTRHFGRWGSALHDFARGTDRREVHGDRERKSLSVEETFPRDLGSLAECLLHLPELYDDWNERVVRAGVAERIRGIQVKIKYFDFKSSTHERVCEGYPKLIDFKNLFIQAFERRPEPVRLIGIGVKLEAHRESSAQLAFDLLQQPSSTRSDS